MNKKIISTITLFFAAVFILVSTSCGNDYLKDDCGCFVNYADALEYAGKKKLPILIFFTSEGDDETSVQLVADVIKDTAFADEIAKKYVVLHADFSQNAYQKTVAPENATAKEQELANNYTIIMQNNYQLAMLFNIETTPAVFLCTKEGYVVSAVENNDVFTNYTEFKDELASYDDELASFNDMVAETKKGSALKKVEAIDTLYRATDITYRTFLIDLAKTVPELDKKNESGLCSKYIVAAAEAEALAAYSQGDVETAVKAYLQAANNEFVKAEDKQECFYTAAYIVAYSGSEDYNGILSYLQTAYELAPDSSKASAIKDAIDYFNTIVENEAELPE
ncbi:MAG: hypothetical protein J6X78_07495 [Treponema sp.]|nr:hypothetical protein [Treponema sp.]